MGVESAPIHRLANSLRRMPSLLKAGRFHTLLTLRPSTTSNICLQNSPECLSPPNYNRIVRRIRRIVGCPSLSCFCALKFRLCMSSSASRNFRQYGCCIRRRLGLYNTYTICRLFGRRSANLQACLAAPPQLLRICREFLLLRRSQAFFLRRRAQDGLFEERMPD